MKFLQKFSAILIFLLILYPINFCSAAKKTVAVMPLENVSGHNEQRVADIMTQQLVTAIHGSGNYTVVERFQMDKILKEQGLQSIVGNSQRAVEQGKLSGADYTLFGKVIMADFINNPAGDFISKFGSLASKYAHGKKCKIKLEFRMVDNATSEVVIAATVEGTKSGTTDEEALNGACQTVAENFLRELQKINPFVARIADISGESVYIDKGSNDGLRTGESLLVFRESDAIVINGKIVGMKSNEVGKVKVIEVYPDYAVCRKDGFLSDIKKGDVVKRS